MTNTTNEQEMDIIAVFNQEMANEKNWNTIYERFNKLIEQEGEKRIDDIDPLLLSIVDVVKKAKENDEMAIRYVVEHCKSAASYQEYYEYVEKLAELDDKESIHIMSKHCFEKKGAGKIKGLKWYLKEAEDGDVVASFRAGRTFELMSKDNEEHLEHAIKFLKYAADNGFTEALYRLAIIYGPQPDGKCRDKALATSYAIQADAKNHILAKYTLDTWKKEGKMK